MTNKPQFVGEKIAFSDAFVEVSRGVKKIKQKDYLPAGDHPIIDQGQDAVSGYACGEEGLFSDAPAIVFGDHTRCVKYVSEPFFAGADGVKILRPKQSDNVRFWWHALRTTRIENLGYSRHFKLLKESRFANYDEQDQRVICENLDRIMDEIDLASRQLAALDSLVKSRFVEMFGRLDANPKEFKVVSFSDLGSWTSGGTPSRKNPDYFEGDIDWYSAGELDSLYLKNSKEKITALAIEESSAKLFAAGSLLVGMYDTAALKLGIATKQCSSNQACANLEPNEAVNLVWLYFAIVQLKPMLLSERSGCRQKNLSLRKIKSFELPLPPLALQQEFADFVAQVDKSRFIAQQQIEKLQMLYDSLAQEYFE